MSKIDALHGPMQMPRTGKATAAVVMLHGYGSDGNDLIGLAPVFAQVLPHAVFYAPHGPSPVEGGFGGYQWFSLRGYDPELVRDNAAARARLLDMPDGVDHAIERLNTYLDQILATHALSADRLALVGFSQGTMMSLHVGLRRPQQIAGIVGYSGAMLAIDKLPREIVTRPPVLLVHGDEDPVVPVAAMADIEQALKGVDVPCEAHVARGVQHGIDDMGLMLGSKFLYDKLGV